MIIQAIARKVGFIQDNGNKIGLFTGDNGVILIDDQQTQPTDRIVATSRIVSNEPIRFLVITHLHPNHTGDYKNFDRLGSMIIGH